MLTTTVDVIKFTELHYIKYVRHKLEGYIRSYKAILLNREFTDTDRVEWLFKNAVTDLEIISKIQIIYESEIDDVSNLFRIMQKTKCDVFLRLFVKNTTYLYLLYEVDDVYIENVELSSAQSLLLMVYKNSIRSDADYSDHSVYDCVIFDR